MSVRTDRKPNLEAMDLASQAKAQFLGFAYWTSDIPVETYSQPIHFNFVIVPYWAIGLTLALLSLVSIRRLSAPRRREKQALARLCTSCGYDLRASPDRCPECGTTVEEI